jgi:hypothetical protein
VTDSVTPTRAFEPPSTDNGVTLALGSPFAAPPEPVRAADQAPGYVVLHEIARGGMGAVFAAEDTALGRPVAVKLNLRPSTAARFVREAEITARLPHPAVPPVHALGTLADGAPFLVMKLIRGETLADLLAARPTPAADLPRFVRVFEQVCQAVGFAHSQGVVHRDLKPAERHGRGVRRGAGHGLGARGRETDEPAPSGAGVLIRPRSRRFDPDTRLR